ncbi:MULTISPECIES: DUF2768 domain-containing protein [Fictibacillus]|jgi:Protein of unknown function (DUF2768)|uniref:DUF2768 domain-containing protein n=1 Tax=Fictibacillus TaxID=1329200 RepID=UPI0018CDDA1B|nr:MULTISPECIES: DUF2768 domain-containing protein [Fictibacillus]MBH0157471.1 DUF2768 domain-containing protein [Fictibacillus sp. 5RED26]MBH0160297.1 DUF2768 domain-containing protein [Fictibacillus sp. 26RED30]MBH0166588.1 DUF2768 domain-containing protein [Fictibacillus sp. 7GRE50]MBH0174401.1 DUF2768 domain-containing protein [Fictibacillus sp. 23RED33]MED1863651.1 DUF2768 domain-containing protein [Fictibacillus nanhaiensis]
MSEGLLKMWVALSAIGLMFVAVFSIMFSRAKLKGIFQTVVSLFAWICMIVAGILIIIVVFSGPVQG